MMTDQMTADAGLLPYLRRYLRAKGWYEKPAKRDGTAIYVFSERDAPDIKVVLPLDRGEQDAGKRVMLALRTLSDLEGRSLDELERSIRRIGSDLIRARFPDAVVWRGDSISLRAAEGFLRRTRRLLLTAAATELNPGKFVRTVTTDCEEFVSKCRFGHTFKGSFGFVIEAPVGPHPDVQRPNEELHPPPFERLVIRRIANGFRIAQRSARLQDANVLRSSYDFGWSADMCDQVVGMYEEADAETLGISIELSSEWSLPSDPELDWNFTIKRTDIRFIKEAAEEMRCDEERPGEPAVVSGLVIRLQSKQNPADLLQTVSPREVVIRYEDPDLGDLSVHVRLAPEDYLRAVEAHGTGRRVRVVGELGRSHRRWDLIPLGPLAVL